jgi:hypothetical protein
MAWWRIMLCVSKEKDVPLKRNPTTKKGSATMKHGRVVSDSLPQAYEVIKEMNPDQDDSDHRSAGGQSLEAMVEGRMREQINWYLDQIARSAEAES